MICFNLKMHLIEIYNLQIFNVTFKNSILAFLLLDFESREIQTYISFLVWFSFSP